MTTNYGNELCVWFTILIELLISKIISNYAMDKIFHIIQFNKLEADCILRRVHKIQKKNDENQTSQSFDQSIKNQFFM